MLRQLLLRSLKNRPGRAAMVTLTLIMGISLVAALLNLTLEVGKQSGQELRAYGANVVLLPQGGGAMLGGSPESQAFISQPQLAALDNPSLSCCLQGFAPYLYGLANLQGQTAVLSGTEFERALAISPWWQVSGALPRGGAAEALIGAELAQRLNLKPGDTIKLNVNGQEQALKLSGTLSTGGSEDNQVLLDLGLAQSLTGLSGKVSAVQVSALTESRSADEVAADLENLVPSAKAKTLNQIAQAEESLLYKINLLMLLVTGLILVVTALTVSAALTNAVIERRRDIGLMKALGAEGGRIIKILLSEVLALGLAAGVTGYLLGLGIAQLIGITVFDTTVPPHLLVAPIALLVALLLALVSALMPIRRALAVEPAVILRGD